MVGIITVIEILIFSILITRIASSDKSSGQEREKHLSIRKNLNKQSSPLIASHPAGVRGTV